MGQTHAIGSERIFNEDDNERSVPLKCHRFRRSELVAEAGADDLRDLGEQWEVVTGPDALKEVRTALEGAGVQVASAEHPPLPVAHSSTSAQLSPLPLNPG